jgi:NDP-sugar pyrophosphorylase family protein
VLRKQSAVVLVYSDKGYQKAKRFTKVDVDQSRMRIVKFVETGRVGFSWIVLIGLYVSDRLLFRHTRSADEYVSDRLLIRRTRSSSGNVSDQGSSVV